MLLSRSAQGLYWMGRYLERAQRLCVMLRLQADALSDRPAREIYFGWQRIYGSMGLQPPGGNLEYMENDAFLLADSYTLAADLTFERMNPGSVWSCFALGRENARQMRHCISAEMWTCLNRAYLRLQPMEIEDIWGHSTENFYAETAAEIDTFAGVAESTMYKDDGWRFMQLGRYIERAQLMTALLLSQIAADSDDAEEAEEDWISLLRACYALDAYDRQYSIEIRPKQALDLLVTDPLLPGSLCRALELAYAEISSVSPGPDRRSCDAVSRLVRRMIAAIQLDWPDIPDHDDMLDRLNEQSLDLHARVTAAYFEYPLATASARR